MSKHAPRQPEDLTLTQELLKDLHDTVLKHEVQILPFAGIPPEADMTTMSVLTAPLTFDEEHAPTAILRTTDQRVILLSVYRHPDTNNVLRQVMHIQDPPANRPIRAELPPEQYELLGSTLGQLAICRSNALAVTGEDVLALQELIDSAEPFNLFGSGEISLEDL